MPWSRRSGGAALGVILCVSAITCAKGQPSSDPPAASSAPAPTPTPAPEQPEPTEEDALARRRSERAARRGAEEDARARYAAAIDALCVAPAPEDLPSSLEEACAQVGAAYDDFMRRSYATQPDVLEKWNAAREQQMRMLETACTQAGSVAVASCQEHALRHAGVEFKKAPPELLQRCHEKYAG